MPYDSVKIAGPATGTKEVTFVVTYSLGMPGTSATHAAEFTYTDRDEQEDVADKLKTAWNLSTAPFIASITPPDDDVVQFASSAIETMTFDDVTLTDELEDVGNGLQARMQ